MKKDFDISYYQDLWEKYRNKQCYICSGWALECDCDNEFTKKDKDGVSEFLNVDKNT